ncbi:MAG TPA: hypothetical protein VN936_03235 [Candidatus Acidoferrum sp.]|nr:hypothetical protein [Candidatus Acidoferrum sp.]
MKAMNTLCDGCGNRQVPTVAGIKQLCADCARKRIGSSALPFLGAAVAADHRVELALARQSGQIAGEVP